MTPPTPSPQPSTLKQTPAHAPPVRAAKRPAAWQALPQPETFFLFDITLGLELRDTKVYEPSLELLRITAKQLFLNREVHRCAPPSVPWQARAVAGPS
jgi:hypothetical protein